jgi:hypothetical protein
MPDKLKGPEWPAAFSRPKERTPSHVMIRCPQSGEGVPAGMKASLLASFSRSSLEEHTVTCPHCGQEHTWSVKDAWIEEFY